jgi:predicted RNase H-like HicB family nuclease
MSEKRDYSILLKKDGSFYMGQCLEIPQARGQGNTKAEAIEDTKKAIKISKSYLESKKKLSSNLVTVSI